MAPTKVASKSEKKTGKSVKKLNVDLGGGLLKYSRAKQYKRKALWRFAGKKRPVVTVPKKPITAVKKINGAKNGGERVVNLLKPKSNYPTKPRVPARPTRGVFRLHKRNTRKSLKPGRIVILLAGAHKGKRVVLLKVSECTFLSRFSCAIFAFGEFRCFVFVRGSPFLFEKCVPLTTVLCVKRVHCRFLTYFNICCCYCRC